MTVTEALAEAAGLPGGQARMSAAVVTLASVAAALGPVTNRDIAMRASHELDGATLRQVQVKQVRTLPAPRHLSGMPDCFSPYSAVAHSPDIDLLTVPDGYLVNLPARPMVVTGHGRTVVGDYGTVYAALAQYYDFDLKHTLQSAPAVDGTLITIADDVWPVNFSHWMVDWLPRLALLGELAGRADTYVAVPPLDAAYQWETLRLCGFEPGRVVQLQPWQAVRARHLLVPGDLQTVPHPGHKSAPWVLTWLRATLGYGAFLDSISGPVRRGRLYVSRNSGRGRRVLNEPALLTALAPYGYRAIDPSAMPVAEQIAAFAGASHIVAPHGAALASIVFSAAGTKLLEMFPSTYGTPAYYVLAAGLGIDYASYIATDIAAGERTQLDDFCVDIADFMARCSAYL